MKTLLIAASIALLALAASAQDVAKVNPKTTTVKLDNDRVRVIEAVLHPGDKERMHSHPASIVYVLSGGVVRSHSLKAHHLGVPAADALGREHRQDHDSPAAGRAEALTDP